MSVSRILQPLDPADPGPLHFSAAIELMDQVLAQCKYLIRIEESKSEPNKDYIYKLNSLYGKCRDEQNKLIPEGSKSVVMFEHYGKILRTLKK